MCVYFCILPLCCLYWYDYSYIIDINRLIDWVWTEYGRNWVKYHNDHIFHTYFVYTNCYKFLHYFSTILSLFSFSQVPLFFMFYIEKQSYMMFYICILKSKFFSITGFRNGCKIGITSHTGSVLATDVIYPPFGKQIHPDSDSSALKLRDLLVKYK